MKECTLSNGLQVCYDTKANVEILDRELFADNIYERRGIVLRNGDCVFDVGANLGFFILYLNQRLQSGTVHAFEPIPATFQLLRTNTERHNRLTLRLHNCGLAASSGTAVFTHFPRTSVASTMFPDDSAEFRRSSRQFVLAELRERHWLLDRLLRVTPETLWFPITEAVRRFYQQRRAVKCELRTLSNVIDEEGIERIDLLKVDTEGAEQEVLAGIRIEHWPRIQQAVIEVHHGPAAVQQIQTQLRQQGFSTVSEPAMPNQDRLHIVFARRESA